MYYVSYIFMHFPPTFISDKSVAKCKALLLNGKKTYNTTYIHIY